MNKNLKRYLEDEMKNVELTRQEIKRIETDILYGSPNGTGNPSFHSDITATKVIALTSHRALERMKVFVMTFDNLYERLPENKKKMLQLLYWSHRDLNCHGVGLEIGVDGSTVGRWRNEIIKQLAGLLGYMVIE